MTISHMIVPVYKLIVIIMVSGGIKVVVGRGRILKEDLPSKITPFVRIKAGSRIADSKRLSLDSIQN